MRFGRPRNRRELVHHNWNRGRHVSSHCNLHFSITFDRCLPGFVFRLSVGCAAAPIRLQHLGLQVFERLIHCRDHVSRFGQANHVAASALHGDFSDIAVLLHRENDLACKVFTEDFCEFVEAEFYLIANGGSDFILLAKILDVH